MSLDEAEEGHQQGVVLESSTTTTSATTSTARSERKRQRERKRRGELSNAFDELASFVVRMDPEPGDADHHEMGRSKKKRGTKSSDRENCHGISQLDIVGRTLKLLKRLHIENEERKRILDTMRFREGQTSSTMIENKTFSPYESNYHTAAYYAGAYPSYSHSFSRHDYPATTYHADAPDTGPPGPQSRTDYWSNDWWGSRPPSGDHHRHHHPF